MVSTVLALIALVLLGFAADLTFLGHVRYLRDQETAYASLRADLANATAPTGQVDESGTPLPVGTPVAVLSIPQLGLRDVVFEGTSSQVTTSGPGHYRSTPLPGQAGTSVLYGRRAGFGGPFQDIGALQPGQTFKVITGQGVQVFQVIDVRRSGDPLPPTLATGSSRLSLATADGPPYQPDGVLWVDANLISPVQPTPALRYGSASFPGSERAMASDPQAWILIVLWGQALLIAAVALAWTRVRWGGWQTWIVGVPVLTALGLQVGDQVTRLLPNLM